MTPEEKKRQRVAYLVVATSSYFGVEIPDHVVNMYVEDLMHLELDELERGFHALRRNPKYTKFNLLPIPAKVIETVRPEVRPEDIAMDLVGKICAAIEHRGVYWPQGYTGSVGKFWSGGGKNWPTFGEAVDAELGPQAWNVICRCGGWQSLHDEYYNCDRSVFKAQLRRGVEAAVRINGISLSKHLELEAWDRPLELTEESKS